MSLSIYYSADRDHPLTDAEQRQIDACIANYPPPAGEEWESFGVYARSATREPARIFQGATKLSLPGRGDVWPGIQHGCRLLTDIRRAVPDAQWRVAVEDHEIVWDDKQNKYRPELD